MKELIPKDNYGIFADNHDVARVDSLYVAKYFEKRHDNVIRDIDNLDCSEEFRLLNFEESSYKNEQGKKQPCYYMTRDGFVFLAMGYRGQVSIKAFRSFTKGRYWLVIFWFELSGTKEQVRAIFRKILRKRKSVHSCGNRNTRKWLFSTLSKSNINYKPALL